MLAADLDADEAACDGAACRGRIGAGAVGELHVGHGRRSDAMDQPGYYFDVVEMLLDRMVAGADLGELKKKERVSTQNGFCPPWLPFGEDGAPNFGAPAIH
ncbi:hypothetical protein ACLOJK_037151 [Asimina triloba]